jgi:membrane dipeptidase
MLMAYNEKNAVGDGCHEPTNSGLSRFGRRLVERMNEVGVIVDVSHTGVRTAMDVMEVSAKPVVYSHSNPAELFPHGRNILAEQVRSCAATGGVVGINGCGMFMADNDVSAEALFRLIDRHVETVGPDHVGIGLDYLYDLPAWLDIVQTPENATRYPDDGDYRRMDVRFADPERVPELAAVMIAHGYAEPDVRKILGENWLRVMRAVWH